MTERQAIRATGTSAYFIVRFFADQCVSAVPAKTIVEPPPGTLTVSDTCIVRWSDGCRYETEVLKIAKDYATAKRYEAEQVSASPPSKSKGKKVKAGGKWKLQKEKSPPASKKSRPPPPKRKKDADKFTIEVGSPPPKKTAPPSLDIQHPAEWYLAPNTLDFTLPPPTEDKSGCSDVSFSSFSSTSDSDMILHSEESIITVDIDSSTQPSTVETGTQTDLMSSCKCDQVMERLSELALCVQTLNTKVDSSFEVLSGRLSLALDAIISLKNNPQPVSFNVLHNS